MANLGKLPIEKVAGFFSFLVKSNTPMTLTDLSKLCNAFRTVAVSTEKVGTKAGIENLLMSIAIFSNISSKLTQMYQAQEKTEEIS